MSTRPLLLCKLEKGKLIDTQENFVDTFNWMVDFINNLRGEKPIEIDNPLTDRPVIKFKTADGDADAEEGDGIEVVTHLEYSANDHQLKMTKRKISAAALEFADDNENKSTVFTATEIDV